MSFLRPKKILQPLIPNTARLAEVGRQSGDQLFWGISSPVGVFVFGTVSASASASKYSADLCISHRQCPSAKADMYACVCMCVDMHVYARVIGDSVFPKSGAQRQTGGKIGTQRQTGGKIVNCSLDNDIIFSNFSIFLFPIGC